MIIGLWLETEWIKQKDSRNLFFCYFIFYQVINLLYFCVLGGVSRSIVEVIEVIDNFHSRGTLENPAGQETRLYVG